MPDDTVRFVWRGRTFELDNSGRAAIRRQLAVQIRRQVWNAPKARFDRWHDRWHWYNNSNRMMRFVVESAGGADFPRQSRLNTIKRVTSRLDRAIAPNTLGRFMQDYPGWYRISTQFNNDMVTYCNRFERGGFRTVRVLEFTRDRSFEALQILATIATGGTSGPAGAAIAAAARRTATEVLVQQVATNFLIRGVKDCAGNIGNAIAGTPPSDSVVARQIMSNAISLVPDALLGGIVERFLSPLTGSLKSLAEQAIRRGNFGAGVTLEVARGRIESAIMDTLQRMFTRNPRDIRQMIEEALKESNDNAAGRRGAAVLMENRTFQNELQARLSA